MSLVDVLRVFQRFWALVVLMLAAGLATSAAALLVVPTTYTSSSRLFVSTQSLGTADELLQGSTYTQARMLSYARIASDPIVLDPVIERLGLDTTADELSGLVSATAERDQLIIEIDAKDGTAIGAADIANAVADELSDVITGTIEAPVAGSDPLVSVTVVKYATPSADPSWPLTWMFLVVGAASGLVLGVGFAFLLGALDTRARNLDDISRLVAAPLIGMVSKDRRLLRHSPLEMMAGSNTFAESIRGIRTNLQFIDAGGVKRRVLLVTSSIPGEGKSTTALSLAASLAEAGSRVVIVDADLRNPSVAKLAGVEGGAGLTDLLLGRVEVDDVIQPIGAGGKLLAIASGRIPPNPAELLGSPGFADLVAQLRSEADYVVVDSPPLLAVADALELSRVVDGVVLVAGAERVRRPQLETAVASLHQIGAPLVGVIANRLARTGVDAYGYYAYGYQAQTETEARGARRAARPDDDAAEPRRRTGRVEADADAADAEPASDVEASEGAPLGESAPESRPRTRRG